MASRLCKDCGAPFVEGECPARGGGYHRAGRTEAQDDGRACVLCGDETSPKVPTGGRGSRGAQLFECARHRKGEP